MLSPIAHLSKRPPARSCRRHICAAALIALLMFNPQMAPLRAESPDALVVPAFAENEYSHLSLEELMAVEVTSVAGVGQEWFRAPAAIAVLQSEQIERNGILHLPEALRLAPGIFYGQVSSNVFAIGSRGFGGRFTSNLLVLEDGRTIYDPGFSGVYWDIHDPVFEDLDRIEVIRGPGATLWGSNAVNGVINITSKSAKDTQGWYTLVGGGSEERAFGDLRYGAAIGEETWFRVYGKYFARGPTHADESGGHFHDEWDFLRGGFRVDCEQFEDTNVTLLGGIYYAGSTAEEVRDAVVAPVPTTTVIQDEGQAGGGYVQFRMERELEDSASWTLQAYYDRTERRSFLGFGQWRDTYDVDFRHEFEWRARHQFVWGAAARHTSDDTDPTANLSVDPRARSLDTFSGFIQDTYAIAPERVFVMLGTKAEDNDVTGFEYQPAARVWWTPDEHQTVWGAISRAVRVPSRADEDVALTLSYADTGLLQGGAPSGVIVPLQLTGDSSLDSEVLHAYEIGYRRKIGDRWSADLATFVNQYPELIATEPNAIGPFVNRGHALTYGFEFGSDYRPSEAWRLEGSYSFIQIEMEGDISQSQEEDTPVHQAQLHSYLDIGRRWQQNTAVYYVDHLASSEVSSYEGLDVGVTYRPTERISITLWGKNLIDRRHEEATDTFFLDELSQVERGVFLSLEAGF